MIKKKVFALMGSILILGAGLVLAADNPDTQAQHAAKKRVESRFQVRSMFVDENGDGICDFARDHDNDGVPNCQDPDWSRPEDGTGYKNRKADNFNKNQFEERKGYHSRNSWNNQSFRRNQANFQSGVCDGAGPKGRNNKRGQS